MFESKSFSLVLPGLLGIAVAMSLAACKPGADSGTASTRPTPPLTHGAHAITGSAGYRERIMMPPGSTLRVQLIDNQLADTKSAVLSEMTFKDLSGPPYAFSLPYDPVKLRSGGQYGLHASLQGPDGKLWFVTDTRTSVDPAGNAPVELQLVRVAPSASGAPASQVDRNISYWQCGELRLGADFSQSERAVLSYAGRELTIPLAVSASGARYADDKGNEFWTKGSSGTLALAGEDKRECSQADGPSPWEAAKARDVGFRAVGNEPGWWVEVGMGEAPQLRAELDYGARRIEVANAQPLKDGAGFSGKTTNGTQVELKIERKQCTDDMSGSSFEASAQLAAGGKTYQGCGAYLQD
ncbi:YbaY family lipoprotein [Lysobacter sp. S4-A87]|uniref:YbaY family lipoprotein n=1 Tax=Lysobacter sp. S4-A87 TaxID=2925843 RepID=UPI001F52E25F|nr:YbaY family lipoprotein [Lysobacter sp. S4-A87]UNK49595.1 YbaY family lipoprotein [Lysobacter sp. S4-A87]